MPALGAAMAADPDVAECGVARIWNWALGKTDIVDTLAGSPGRDHPGADRRVHGERLQAEGPDLRRLHQRRLREVLRRMTMSRFGYTLAILASSVLASACTDDLTADTQPAAGRLDVGGDETRRSITTTAASAPWDLLDRLTKEGPPRYTSHVHSLPEGPLQDPRQRARRRSASTSANTTALSAGDLYTHRRSTRSAVRTTRTASARTSASRPRAPRASSTSSRPRADEIIAAFADPNAAGRRLPGRGAVRREQHVPARRHHVPHRRAGDAAHLDFCNLTVTSASDVTDRQAPCRRGHAGRGLHLRVRRQHHGQDPILPSVTSSAS